MALTYYVSVFGEDDISMKRELEVSIPESRLKSSVLNN